MEKNPIPITTFYYSRRNQIPKAHVTSARYKDIYVLSSFQETEPTKYFVFQEHIAYLCATPSFHDLAACY